MKNLTLIITVIVLVAGLAACGAPKAEETTGAANAVSTETAALSVRVLKLEYHPFQHYFSANGTVEAVDYAYISPEINGQIKEIHVKEGQRVQKGHLLVSLNSEVIRNGIKELESGLELAQTVFNKRKDLWEKNIGSEIQYLQAKTEKDSMENRLESLKAQLKMANIKAPISGIVDKIHLKAGELASPGLPLIQLVDLSKVYVNTEVSEAYLPKLQKGDIVNVSFPTFPQLSRETPIHRTGNIIRVENRTFLVQLKLDNTEEKLKPNMIAIVKMKDFYAQSALVVPSIIIKNDLTGSYCYVAQSVDGKLTAQKAYVEPGLSEGHMTMINKGLEAGQEVITEGYNLVKHGMAVTVAPTETK